MTSKGIVQIVKDKLETDNALEFTQSEVQIDQKSFLETTGIVKCFVDGRWLRFRVYVEQLGLEETGLGA